MRRGTADSLSATSERLVVENRGGGWPEKHKLVGRLQRLEFDCQRHSLQLIKQANRVVFSSVVTQQAVHGRLVFSFVATP